MGPAKRKIDTKEERKNRVKQKVYNQLDKELDKLFKQFEDTPNPTLMQMSEMVKEIRTKMVEVCSQTFLEEKYADRLNQLHTDGPNPDKPEPK